jgi:hypothetical protein
MSHVAAAALAFAMPVLGFAVFIFAAAYLGIITLFRAADRRTSSRLRQRVAARRAART